MKDKKQAIETEEQKQYRELADTIAGNIANLAKAVNALMNGPLKKKALVILLAHSAGQTQYSVDKILIALSEMEKDWLNK